MADEAATRMTPHQAAKRIHEVLSEQLSRHGDKSPLLQRLKKEHPDVYSGLISECKTHGPSIKGKITEFVNDAAKPLPEERLNGVRKALEIIEKTLILLLSEITARG